MFGAKRALGVVAALGLCSAPFALSSARADEAPRSLPSPQVDETPAGTGLETAVLSGGCFWGVQGVFEHVKGVHRVVSGYWAAPATRRITRT